MDYRLYTSDTLSDTHLTPHLTPYRCDCMWTLGYRGLNDYPFWEDEPQYNTTSSRCKLINEAMAAQAR